MTAKAPTHEGLAGQILYIEENIAIKKKLGKDTSFEEELVKEWRRYLKGGDKHHLWVAHSMSAFYKEKALKSPQVKI